MHRLTSSGRQKPPSVEPRGRKTGEAFARRSAVERTCPEESDASQKSRGRATLQMVRGKTAGTGGPRSRGADRRSVETRADNRTVIKVRTSIGNADFLRGVAPSDIGARGGLLSARTRVRNHREAALYAGPFICGDKMQIGSASARGPASICHGDATHRYHLARPWNYPRCARILQRTPVIYRALDVASGRRFSPALLASFLASFLPSFLISLPRFRLLLE